jgi:hypothetical protein
MCAIRESINELRANRLKYNSYTDRDNCFLNFEAKEVAP